ncbi:MAG: energy coupling factor transporter S component ThiW, partial [Candidatus Mcinerneyibacterium aminivorans]
GALASYPIAKFLIGKEIAVFFFIVPFLVSTMGGSIIAYFLLKILEKSNSLNKWMDT